ncbi:hypothetical protein [Kosakonia sp.]|uniref:hypothetical protein n=1 Tax=Kosakonia sp. TaxID=1916651 RepID=UPI0028A951ED|nr:hypothetical protein [Kosakonia sp.]
MRQIFHGNIFLPVFLILLVSFFSFDAAAVIDINHYDTLETVENITVDKQVQASLKNVLGADYAAFAGNFDVYGEPRHTADGGLFVEGWLKDLYLENASAFVIYPDGRLSAAWVVPAASVAHYKSNTGEKSIPDALQQWGSRFQDVSFNTPAITQTAETFVDFFETPKFKIKVVTVCGNGANCDEATYYGVRKNDRAEVNLHGFAVRKSCEQSICPVITYTFKNGTTTYLLSKIDNSLTVIQNNKILLDEKGIWKAHE